MKIVTHVFRFGWGFVFWLYVIANLIGPGGSDSEQSSENEELGELKTKKSSSNTCYD